MIRPGSDVSLHHEKIIHVLWYDHVKDIFIAQESSCECIFDVGLVLCGSFCWFTKEEEKIFKIWY